MVIAFAKIKSFWIFTENLYTSLKKFKKLFEETEDKTMPKIPTDCTMLCSAPCDGFCLGCGFSVGEVDFRRALIRNHGMVWKDGKWVLVLKRKENEK